jgi:hypothetical protein
MTGSSLAAKLARPSVPALNLYYGAAHTIVCGATFSIQAILYGFER